MTYVSFDPYMYNRHADVVDRCKGNLYPDDIRLALRNLRRLEGAILLQMSTYSAQYRNQQEDVTASLDSILGDGGLGFTRRATVRLDGNMMSLVYTRDVSAALSKKLKNLPDDFNNWFSEIAA